MQVLVILALAIAVGATVFALQNPGVVGVQFLAWRFEGSLALVLLISFVLGFLTSFLLSLASLVRRRLAIRALQRRVAELERPGAPLPSESSIPS